MDCLFCSIVDGKIPAHIVFENELVLAFRDIHPQAPTHILVIPKKHIANLIEILPEDGPLMVEITQAIRSIAESENLHASGFRVVTNVGRDAGQTVFHLHFHLLGGRRLTWPPG